MELSVRLFLLYNLIMSGARLILTHVFVSISGFSLSFLDFRHDGL